MTTDERVERREMTQRMYEAVEELRVAVVDEITAKLAYKIANDAVSNAGTYVTEVLQRRDRAERQLRTIMAEEASVKA
jgi:hypothetical protein